MSRPRPSPPATWPSRRARALTIRAPLPHFPTSLPHERAKCRNVPPWARRHFARSCVRALAARALSPSPLLLPPRERAKCPCHPADEAGHFARSCGGRRAAGEIRAAAGWKRLPGGAGRPDGVATGLQVVACSARGSRGARAGGTSGCARRATAAFRPLGWARPYEIATGARPTASGRNTAVRPRGDRGISPARGHDARRQADRCSRRGGSDRLEVRGGLPGSRWVSRRSPAPHAAHVGDERAEHPGASARRARHFARSRIGRAGRVTEHRPPSPSTTEHGPGGRSGTYGRHAERE